MDEIQQDLLYFWLYGKKTWNRNTTCFETPTEAVLFVTAGWSSSRSAGFGLLVTPVPCLLMCINLRVNSLCLCSPCQ